MLVAELSLDGTAVRLGRSDVPPGLWNSVVIRMEGARVEPDGNLVVPVGQFLQKRDWLGHALRDHGCDIDADDSLKAVLARGKQEQAEVTALLAGDNHHITTSTVAAELATVGFKRTLKDFQLRDLARLAGMSHGANFSVPGAGKTTVAYALHALERGRGRIQRLLVVAPLSAFGAWEEESEECFNTPLTVARLTSRGWSQAQVVLVNYQRLASGFDNIARWLLEQPAHVILDEAHRMKAGRQGEWGRMCLELAHVATRRDILTGTPAPQHPNDFEALIDFVWPQQSHRILPRAALRGDPPPTVMQEVSARLAPLFARTNKSELGLDEPDRKVELVTMGPVQAEIYEALRTRLRYATNVGARERLQLGQMGRVAMYLLEAASNPALLARPLAGTDGPDLIWPSLCLDPGTDLGDMVRGYSSIEVPAKFRKLAAMIETNANAGRKTLVWSNFVPTLKTLATQLLAPHHPALIHGAVPVAAADGVTSRETELRRFRSDPDCHVLLANPAAMSEGVSLHHECHDAIYVDRTFNAGQYLQSIDRIHRLGLPPGTDTSIRFLMCRETVDETVDDRIRVKAERLAQMLSDKSLVTMSLPDEDDYGEWVEEDDLDALLGHLGRG